MLKRCKVCGAEYEVCISCERNHSWKVHTDTEAHYYIFTVLMGYQSNRDAKQAYSALRKRGIDFHNTAGYTPSVQALLTEIYTLTHQNSKGKKAVDGAKKAKTEEPMDSEAESQQGQ